MSWRRRLRHAVGGHERGWRRVGDVVIVLAVVAVIGLAVVAVVRPH